MASVLVVDDAAFMRMTVKRMLEAHGHTMAAEAENGLEAVQKFNEVRPDIVLLDITMPEMNGIEALKQIKEIDENARIIICSTVGQQLVAEAIQCGATDFIIKPFEEERLMESIERAMNK